MWATDADMFTFNFHTTEGDGESVLDSITVPTGETVDVGASSVVLMQALRRLCDEMDKVEAIDGSFIYSHRDTLEPMRVIVRRFSVLVVMSIERNA